jgi:hypothetical protein
MVFQLPGVFGEGADAIATAGQAQRLSSEARAVEG